MGGGRRKNVPTPNWADAPLERKPKSAPIRDHLIRFRFDMMHPHKWCPRDIEQRHVGALLAKLAYFERMTVEQARGAGFLSDYDLSDVPNKNAVSVWKSHMDDEYDTMCRLVIEKGGPLRLMGARVDGQFHIVFWDPAHQIWPEGKIAR